MELIELIIHFDRYLAMFIEEYGILTYGILFLIIFLETGLVVTPFLPGDSLIFAAGAFAALGSLNIFLLIILLMGAAILGDTANYHIGKKVGYIMFTKEKVRFINKEHLQKTKIFFERHGGKTIVIARFMPIIRTFAPFVAGGAKMHYTRFLRYNIIGGTAWVIIFSLAGYFFGNLSFVKENFSFVLIAIVVISLAPIFISKIFSTLKKKNKL